MKEIGGKTMNKEIEEMMLTVPQKIVAYDGNPAGQHLYGEQRQQIAETLYNAGYRKTFTSDFASDTQKAFKEGYEKAQDEIARQKKEIEYWKAETKEARKDIDEAVKETAKNIIEKLKEKANNYYPSIDHYCCSDKAIKLADIDELLKEYEK